MGQTIARLAADDQLYPEIQLQDFYWSNFKTHYWSWAPDLPFNWFLLKDLVYAFRLQGLESQEWLICRDPPPSDEFCGMANRADAVSWSWYQEVGLGGGWWDQGAPTGTGNPLHTHTRWPWKQTYRPEEPSTEHQRWRLAFQWRVIFCRSIGGCWPFGWSVLRPESWAGLATLPEWSQTWVARLQDFSISRFF